ncbi:MAG: transposase, partial [Bacteroidota bacterium]
MSGDRYFIRDQNALYFITPTIVNWLDVFVRHEYKHAIVDSLNYCVENKGLNIYAWCLMTSHLHLVASARDGFQMSDILRDFKKFTANKI